MSVASQFTFCTQADIASRLSADGLLSLLDDNQDGVLDANEQQALTDCISDASETICFYTWQKYDPSVLAQGYAWVNRRCVDFACYSLAGRRSNPIPDSVYARVEKAEKDLLEIRDGVATIPFAPLRRRLAPVWSNTRVVPSYQFKCIRVEPQTSSPPSKFYANQPDYEAAFTFEI